MKVHKITRLLTCMTLAFALTSGQSHAAELLVNGDFENEPNYKAPNLFDSGSFALLSGTQIPGWTIVAGHGVTIHNHPSVFNYPTISGTYSVNTDGEGYDGSSAHYFDSNGHNGDFYQDFQSAAGTNYSFKYDWENWSIGLGSSAKLEVTIIDLTTNASLYAASWNTTSGVDHVSASFVGTGDMLRLEIRENPESGTNDNKFIVDNFSVTDAGGTVPEPSTMAQIGLGVVGLAVHSMKRRRSIAQ